MPHGKKSAVDNFANVWMLDYVIIIFSMVRYNKYEYLQHKIKTIKMSNLSKWCDVIKVE